MFVDLFLISLLVSSFASAVPTLEQAYRGSHAKTCVVKAGRSVDIDDAPAIIEAFDKCGRDGKVSFLNTTYHVNTVMNITGLKNCEIDLQGTLLWSTNITYWLQNSYPVGYQNQSTAFIISGDNINFDGHGYGTFNGNGDVWYDFVGGISNYPRRPIALTVANTTNSVFQNLRFIRSQMWTMAIIYTENLLFDSIYVNNTPSAGGEVQNTDGADTIYSSHITFNKWIVDNGDDSISTKANSTDIIITNSVFYNGDGIALGSIGQYKGVYETLERIYAKNIVFYGSAQAAYVKTWTGQQEGYPPNGGGGGLGLASGVVFEDFAVYNLRGPVFDITQCTSYNGIQGNCTNSAFQIEDITVRSVKGTTTTSTVASLQCSAVKPCTNITLTDISVQESNGTEASQYLCQNVVDNKGFSCTGPVSGE